MLDSSIGIGHQAFILGRAVRLRYRAPISASSGGIPDLRLRTAEEPFDSVRGCHELADLDDGNQRSLARASGDLSVARAVSSSVSYSCWSVAQW